MYWWCCETRNDGSVLKELSYGCIVTYYLGTEPAIVQAGCYRENLTSSSHLFLALVHLAFYHVMMSTKTLCPYPKSCSWISCLQKHGSINHYVHIGLCYSVTIREKQARPQNNYRCSVDLNVKSTTVKCPENCRLDDKKVIKKIIVSPTHLSVSPTVLRNSD